MLLFIRIFLVLFGLIALVTGFMGSTHSFDTALSAMQDNNSRFTAAIWGVSSLAFFYVAWNPSEVAVFRFLMIAVFIGGLVRAYGLRFYPATGFFIFIILLELIPTALMLWMHFKLLKTGVL